MARKHGKNRHYGRPQFEELEPRILYSADLAPQTEPPAEVRVEPASAEETAEATQPPYSVVTQEDVENHAITSASEALIFNEADLSATDTIASERQLELVFINDDIVDPESFINDLVDSETTDYEAITLNSHQDGFEQILNAVNQYENIDAIHFVTHGDNASIKLGNLWINPDNLNEFEDEFRVLGLSLADDADLLFYGCDIAESDTGQSLIDTLSDWTEADISASTNLTGSSQHNADWELEYIIGPVETQIAFSNTLQSDWNGVLNTYTVSNTNDSGAGSLRQAIISANANGGIDTIEFSIIGPDPYVINLASQLPDITDTVIIDGTTEDNYSGSPVIVLNGGGTISYGLRLNSGPGGSTIQGLVLQNFTAAALDIGTSNNSIVGNYIGTDATGTVAAGSTAGINIWQGSNNTVGGNNAADRNIISGNSNIGVVITGTSDSTTVQGNYIGTDVTGTLAIGNTNAGIWSDVNNSVIGGTGTGEGNLISGNGNGVTLNGDGTTVEGNLIGTDVSGTLDLGNNWTGVYIVGGDNNQIGGSSAAARNVISGNNINGINIDSGSANLVQGNYIGTDVTGTSDVSNTDTGVLLENASTNNIIGGTGANEGNIIAHNASMGIVVSGAASINNAILSNAIHSNSDIGIGHDLDGVTANDTQDPDTGGNNLQNYPKLDAAVTDGSHVQIIGLLNSTANTDYRIEFFASASADPSGHGEAERYLGAISVTTDSAGNANIYADLVAAVVNGEIITATATVDLGGGNYGDTSEFAANVVASDDHTPSDITATKTLQGGLQINNDGGDDTYLVADNGIGSSNLSSVTYEMQFNSTSTSRIVFLSYYNGGDELRLITKSDGDLNIAINNISIFSSAMNYDALSDGQDHSLSFTWDNSAGDWEVFIDGSLVDSGTGLATGATIDAGGSLVFGLEQDNSELDFDNQYQRFSGTLYDARLFDTVRTDQEIAANYRATLPRDETNLIANWQFDAISTGGVVTDTVKGNNLTVAHFTDAAFTASTPTLNFELDENSVTGTVIGNVSGTDAERDALIASLLTADPDLRYSAETGKFYKAVLTTTDWATAEANALATTLNSINGQLATIRNATEHDTIADFASSAGQNLYLGATDQTAEGEWRWREAGADAEQFWQGDNTGYAVNNAYTRFFAGEPNDIGGQDYLAMYSFSQWDDENSNLGYIIEWDAKAVLDASQALAYSIQSQTVAGAFSIDADTGQISVSDGSLLDYETNATHTLTIRITDVDSNTYDKNFDVQLNDLTEPASTPTDLSSGIELNTDGGNDAYLQASDGGALLGGLTKLSLEVTFASDQPTEGLTRSLISYTSASDGDELFLGYGDFGASEEFYFSVQSQTVIVSFDAANVFDGEQHAISVSWESSNGDWALYIDGEFLASGTGLATGATIDGTSGNLIIGHDADAGNDTYTMDPDNAFAGALYDIRIWNEVRSEAEIALNYQQKFDSGSLPSGLIANWQMDGFNGSNEVVDVVSGNNLSIGHAVGAGFTASTPVDDLHISESAANGTRVGFVVPSDPDVSNDIVSDGLFTESSDPGTEIRYTSGQTFGDWTVDFGDVDHHGNIYADSPLGGHSVGLNGSTAGAISQALVTEAGKQYQVVFALTGEWDGGDAVKDLRVSVGGVSSDFSITQLADWSELNPLWEHRSFTFTADGTSSTLQFASLDAGSDGAVIADVQVVEIPRAVSTILNNDPTLSYDAATGKFYKVTGATEQFTNAQTTAGNTLLNRVSGQLVTIDSAYENQVIRNIADVNLNWMGASDASIEDEWRWLDGNADQDQFSNGAAAINGYYSNWASGQPNGGNLENYGYIDIRDGEWGDSTHLSTLGVIIEWDASEVLSNFTFSLTDDAGGRFAIDSNSGEVTVADTSQIDYETATSHNVTVEVTDAAGNTYSEVMGIQVNDVLAVPDSYSVDENAVLNVTTPGVLTNDAVIPVTDHTVLGFDAASDIDGNANWTASTGSHTLTGSGVTYTTSPDNAPAGITAAYDFDGTGGLTSAELDSLPEVDGTQSATIEVWILVDNPANNQIIMDSGHPGLGGMGLSINAGELEISIGEGGTNVSDQGGTLSASTWHHVAVTFDMDAVTPTATVYLDGVQTAQVGLASFQNWSQVDFALGDDPGFSVGGSFASFAGQISHFRVQNEILTPAIISANTASPGAPASSLSSVVSYDDSATLGNVVVNSDGSFTYDPNGQFSSLTLGQSASDSFTYTIDDGIGNQETVIVSITVDGVTLPFNSAPYFTALPNADPTSIESLSDASSVTSADLDNDGDIDLISTTSGGELRWHENDGSGNFAAGTLIATAQNFRAVATYDLEGDGDMDIVAMNDDPADTANSVYVLTNNFIGSGSVSFSTQSFEGSVGGESDGGQDLAIGDIDGDGRADIAGIFYRSIGDSQLVVFEQNAVGVWTKTYTDAISNGHGVEIVDLDGDTDLDIVTGDFQTREITFYENDGNATAGFTAQLVYDDVAEQMFDMTVGDFDADGDQDIAYITWGATDKIVLLENDGAANPSFTYSVIATETGGLLYHIDTADTNGDGTLDLIVVNETGDSILIYENDGSAAFTKDVIDATSRGPVWVEAADVDGDGENDLIFAARDDNFVGMHLNQGSGSYIRGSVNEDIALGSLQVQVADDDIGAGELEITITVTNGRIIIPTGSVTVTAGASSTPTITFTGTVADVNTAMNSFTFAPDTDFYGLGEVQIVVNDQGNTDGPAETATKTFFIDVLSMNDAPVLDNSGDLTLNTITEDDIGNSGQTVASILASDSGNPITDVDSGAAEGIAITSRVNGRGMWQYSIDGGSNWSNVGTVSETSALLLRDTDLVRFEPDGMNGTGKSFTFRAWDQTSGDSAGDKVDVSSNGGTTAFSSADETVTITVTAVNDAPVLDNSGALALTAQSEDSGSPVGAVGTLVSALVSEGGNVTDVDASSVTGVALVATDTANGNWWFSTDNGSSWSAVGSASESNARLLNADANTRLYFEPDANFNGTISNAITFRAWDQASGSNGGVFDITVSGTGGTTAFSTATETADITINAANDDPTNAGSLPTDVTVTEDVATNIDLSAINLADVDAASGSLTVTLSTSPSGQLSAAVGTGITVGGSATARTLTGSLTDLNAYLDDTSKLSYVHSTTHLNGNDADTISVVINDGGNTGSGGGTDVSLGSVNVDIAAVNDSPLVATNTGTTVAEGGSVTITTSMLTEGDVDDSGTGLTWSVTSAPSNGQLELSTNVGVSIASFTQDDLDNNRVVYVHDDSQTSSDSFDFSLGDGGENSSVAATGTFNFTVTNVNDAPVNTVPGAQSVNEDTSLSIGGISVADDDDNLSTVRLTVSNGTLDVTLSGTATISAGSNNSADLSLSGSLADINATLASLAYQGTLNFNGSDTLTMLSTDASAATDSDTVAITVNAVNDEPSFTTSGNQSAAYESGAQTVAGFTTPAVGGGTDESGQTFSYTVSNDNNALFSVQPSIDASGQLTYTVANSQSGTATVTVSVTDSGGTANAGDDTSPDQTFDIIIADNTAPTISAIANQTMDEDGNTGALAFTVADAEAAAGVLTVSASSSDQALISDANLTLVDLGSGNWTITATSLANINGSATITVTVDDGTNTTDETFVVTVDAVNDEPGFTTVGNQSVAYDSGAHTVAGFASPSAGGAADESGQTFSYTASNDNNALFSVQPSIDASGQLTYTVANNQSGTATVTVSVTDSGGTANGGDDTSPDQTFDITIAVNTPPTITPIADQTMDEDNNTGALGFAVADAETTVGSLTATAVSSNQALIPDANLTLIDLGGGNWTVNATPLADMNGSATVTVTVDDGTTTTDETFLITVNPVNDAPTDIAPLGIVAAEHTDSTGGLALGSLTTSDVDSGDSHSYSITGGADSAHFTLGGAGSDELIMDDGILDFENQSSYSVEVTATDAFGASVFRTITVSITDVNEAPSLSLSNLLANLAEDTDTTSSIKVADIAISDDALGTNTLTLTGTDSALFEIVGNELRLRAGTTLDHEAQAAFDVGVRVDDAGVGGSPDDGVDITLTITDVNEFDPVVADQTLNIAENSANGSSVGTVIASDPDTSQFLTFNIIGGNTGAAFSIDPLTGEILVNDHTQLDFETSPVFNLTVEVNDNWAPMRYTQASITIAIDNLNDLAPAIDDPSILLAEDAFAGTSVFDFADRYTAGDTDRDGDILSYSLVSGNDQGHFSIDASTGVVTLDSGTLDFESVSTYTLTVQASDGSFTDSAALTITIDNINEAPIISAPTTISTDEDIALDFTGNLTVSDPDAGNTDIEVTLSSSHGVLLPGDQSGLSSLPINNALDHFVLRGSATSINAALNGLQFIPDTDFNGEATLSIEMDDLGETGLGAALQDIATIQITVNPVNDEPALELPNNTEIQPGEPLRFSTALENLQPLQDIDSQDSMLELTLNIDHGQLSIEDSSLLANITHSDGASFSATGDVDTLNKIFNALVITPDLGYFGELSLDLTINDLGGSGIGGLRSISSQITLYVPEPALPDNPDKEEVSDEENASETPSLIMEPVIDHRMMRDTVISPDTDIVISLPNKLSFNLESWVENDTLVAVKLKDAATAPVELMSGKPLQTQPKASLQELLNTYSLKDPSSMPSFKSISGSLSEGWANTDDAHEVEWNILMAEFGGASLVVGSLVWLLKGSSLASSLLVSYPAWRGLDPLPVLLPRETNRSSKSATAHARPEQQERPKNQRFRLQEQTTPLH